MLLVLRAMMVTSIVACCVFLVGVSRQGEPLREESFVVEPATVQPPSATTIVDVAPGVSRDRIPSLIALAPGERVSAVGERAVGSDLEAGAAIAALAPATGRFVDLTVDGTRGTRRVLVLVH